MNIFEKLVEVQNRLKVGKENYNSFGKYKYRSCGDIFEAVKPLLREYKLTLIVTDELVLVGDRYYIKAKAILIDTEKPEAQVMVEAFAREDLAKKGMDDSQVTGSSSTYSRKYALNGMFAIDDSLDDPDKTNKHGKDAESQVEEQKVDGEAFISESQQRFICGIAPIEDVKRILLTKGYTKSADIKVKDFVAMCELVKVMSKAESLKK